jgi:hypothetical protein
MNTEQKLRNAILLIIVLLIMFISFQIYATDYRSLSLMNKYWFDERLINYVIKASLILTILSVLIIISSFKKCIFHILTLSELFVLIIINNDRFFDGPYILRTLLILSPNIIYYAILVFKRKSRSQEISS